MTSRVNTKSSQLYQWINRIFPPSSPRVTQPAEMDEVMKLVMPALPPSLLMERCDIQHVDTVNPATLAVFPTNGLGVPRGRFMWVHACDWQFFSGANLAVAGWAGIAVRKVGAPAGQLVTMATGFFGATTNLEFVGTHSLSVNPLTPSQLGGGVGSFLVPQGMEIFASTAATPGATSIFRLNVMYTECDIGELIPGIS